MTESTQNDDGGWERWRIAAWAGAAALLVVPLVAGFPWTTGDYLFASILLFGSLGAYELARRLSGSTAYRAGAGVALLAAFLLFWINGAVGITDGEADGWLFLTVLTIGFGGAIVARFRPRGMALAMFATALSQSLIAAYVLMAGMVPAHNTPFEVVGLIGFFVALFVGSGLLFHEAARDGAVPIGDRSRPA